jgi:hypothetical protein
MRLIRAWLVFVSAFFSFGCFRLLPQSSLSVAPNTLQITMAASGPLAYPQSFTIGAGTSGVAWKANVSEDSPWIRLSAASGVTPAKVMVSLVDWRMGSVPPGMHKGKISVTAAGMTPDRSLLISTAPTAAPNRTGTRMQRRALFPMKSLPGILGRRRRAVPTWIRISARPCG